MSHRYGSNSFKGNKQHLPSKPCQLCGREMSWRKSWAKNWDQVLYCSEACRKNKNNTTPPTSALGKTQARSAQ